MIFHIEFPTSKSKYHESLLRACGRLKGFRKSKRSGFYSIMLAAEPVETLHAIFEMSKMVAGTLYYRDGVLVTQRDVYQAIWSQRNKHAGKIKIEDRYEVIKAILPEIAQRWKDINSN